MFKPIGKPALLFFFMAAFRLFCAQLTHNNLVGVTAFHNQALAVRSHRPHFDACEIQRRYMSDGSNSNQQQQQVIQSQKSTTVKNIQALLAKRKKRLQAKSTIVEGPRMIFDLLENETTGHLVQQVVVSSERQDWIQQLHQQQHSSLRVVEGTPQVLKACTDTVTPQGIVAVVSIPEFELVQKQYPLFLVCDGVSDPGNIGTLLRSSVAVGAAGVILLPQCCDVWNPKAVRSAMGCTFQIPIINVDSWDSAQSLLSEWGVTNDVYAATMDKSGGAQSLPHYEVDWTTKPSALIIGSEGNGLSEDVRNAVADGTIQATHVDMEPGIESLNAAVCGSVVLFEFLRQCRTQS